MAQQVALPEKLRTTFEQYGVIKRVAVPKLDLLDKAICDRKGKWELSKNSEGIAVAKVTMLGRSFDGAADESGLALSIAFAQAMIATQPRQGDLFDPPEPSPEATHLSNHGVTVTVNGKSATTPEEIDAAVGEVVSKAMGVIARHRVNSEPSNVTADQAEALNLAGATST